MFEFVEKSFDEISVAIQVWAECGDALSIGHGFDTGPGAALFQGIAHGVTVIGVLICTES